MPTQIVTEDLLRMFAKGQLVAGLLYPSASPVIPASSYDLVRDRWG
jgi:hypothetical protein